MATAYVDPLYMLACYTAAVSGAGAARAQGGWARACGTAACGTAAASVFGCIAPTQTTPLTNICSPGAARL